jgi:hypothetical protein
VAKHWAGLAVGILVAGSACGGSPEAVNTSPAAHASAPPTTPSPSPLPLAISAAPFHAAEMGLAYRPVTPTAKGGVPPYTWEVTAGSLPAGLVMSAAGKVTGTPTILGTYLFTIRVADSSGASATLNSSISVTRRVVVTGNPCTPVSPCSVEAGCLTVCAVFGFQTGGIAPYRYRVVSGVLPTGMGLSGFTLTKAFPAPGTQAGKDWQFTVRVTDAIGATAETTARFHVFPHIRFTGALTATCSGTRASGCNLSVPLPYALGTPGLDPVTVKVIAGPALHFTALGGSVTAIAGSNCAVTPKPPGYTGTVKIVLQDTSTCGANLYCTSGTATVTINLSGC